MKVILIYPLLSRDRSRSDENKQYWPPLGLAYIAAVLEKNNHDVQILDRDYILRKHKFDFKKTDEATLGLIESFGTNIVGFSATTPNISDVNWFSGKIKRLNHKIVTVIGGPHCIGEPILTLELCSGIDMLVRGEGEMTMLDIANGKDLDRIEGLTYREKNGCIVSNPDRPLIESLDDLPFPARHLLAMDYYTRPSRFISRNLSLRTTHIFTARGCPYNCYYCAGPLMGRRKVRYHSSRRVVLEIEDLINKYSIEAIYFAEDMFLSDKRRALEMSNLFVERGIHKKIVWMAQISTNAVDEELLSIMRKSGCIHVEYGFESGSQRILDLMNKKASVERNKKVSFLTKKSGLRFQGNFIVGYPGETEEDFNKTILFIKKTRPNNISLNLFMPLPGTQIYKRLERENRLKSNWDDIGNPEVPYINYADMPMLLFEKLYFKAKLQVVLPINLINFIKDNISHPFRLLYISATQFKSVIRRMFKAIVGLLRTNNNKEEEEIKVLFIAYQSVSDPIMESQVFSYIRRLSEKKIRHSILSYETKQTVADSRNYISRLDLPIKWRKLTYHHRFRFLATCFDILSGMAMSSFIIKKDKIHIIHARGFIPALIAFLPTKLFRIKFFFDTRGFLADKYIGGYLLDENSFIYKLMKWWERILMKECDYFTVETNKHAEIIQSLQRDVLAKMDVIPCCVDMNKFNFQVYPKRSDREFKLVYLGKIGTWYLIDKMLDFFNVISKEITNSRFIFLTQDDPKYIYSIAKNKRTDESRIEVIKPNLEEIPIFLAKSNAGIFFINPYKRYNSSPIKFGEYLACGLPVVINRGIGDTEVITRKERVGVVVDDLSESCYKAAIRELMDLLEETDKLRMRCRITAEKYLSLEKGTEKYLQIYQKLLKDESLILGPVSYGGTQ